MSFAQKMFIVSSGVYRPIHTEVDRLDITCITNMPFTPNSYNTKPTAIPFCNSLTVTGIKEFLEFCSVKAAWGKKKKFDMLDSTKSTLPKQVRITEIA